MSVLATVTLKDGESQESLLKRFRKEVMQERILSEVRRKRWYISPSEMRRIQKQRAIRRARRRQRQREARQKYS
ncbi:MAG TPA: 30S ribosomal protein S21 [Anaerolineae bacterium]|nr:30S ribosomal protein S21 [Anaerolineae bacterium]